MRLGLTLGLTRGKVTSSSFTKETLDFSTSVPADFTNTKTGTTSTYRNSLGNWQKVNANGEMRIHKFEDLEDSMLLVESAGNNFCKCRHYNVASILNMTLSGDASATLSLADDATTTSLINNSELQDLITNNKLYLVDNSAGTSQAFVTIGGTVANTTPHSLSVFAAGDSANAGSFALTGNAVSTDITGTSLVRYRQDGTTPNATTDEFVITVEAGKKLYFIIPQLEDYAFCTTPIITTSAGGASRSRDNISAPYSNGDGQKGGMVVEFYHPNSGVADEGYVGITDSGTGSVNRIGIRTLATKRQIEMQCTANSVNYANDDVSGIIPSRINKAGYFWNDTLVTTVAPNMRFNEDTKTAFSANLEKIWIGKYSQYNGHANCGIKSIVLYKGGTPTLIDLGKEMIPANAIGYAQAMSQSNNRVYGRDQTSGSNNNDGEIALVEELQTLYPTKVPFMVDGAISGSSMYKTSSAPNRWLNIDTGDDGEALTRFKRQAEAFGWDKIKWIDSNIGETDASSIDIPTWKTYMLDGMSRIEAYAGKTFIKMFTPRAWRNTVFDRYQDWREANRQIVAENANYYMTPETVWVDEDPANNNLHLSAQGAKDFAKYKARRAAQLDGITVEGGVSTVGAEIIYAERQGTDVYMSFEHDGDATDFTPTTGIEGEYFTDNGTLIASTAHVRYNANTSKITLASVPVGTENLAYLYGSLSYMDKTKAIRDNSTYNVPLQGFQQDLPYAKYDFDQFSGLLIWQDSSVQTTVSQRDDLSGNGYHAVQASATLQPTIATAENFGKDALKYDSTDDEMRVSTNADLQALSDTATFEFVWKGTPTANYLTIFDMLVSNGVRFQNDSASNMIVRVATSAGSQVLSTRPSGLFDGNIHHIVFRINAGQADMWVDGAHVLDNTYDNGTNGIQDASQFIKFYRKTNMYDFAFALYNTALTDAQIAQKWLHAKARWDI